MSDGAEVVERLNVALIEEASVALVKLWGRTGMKRVDLINRAVQLLEFVDAEERGGRRLALVDDAGSIQVVTME